jgi:hypothetical protein
LVRVTVEGLSNYVIRHISIYGNIMSSSHASPVISPLHAAVKCDLYKYMLAFSKDSRELEPMLHIGAQLRLKN